VVIQFRAENLNIAPVFGPAALAVSPGIGHVHAHVERGVVMTAGPVLSRLTTQQLTRGTVVPVHVLEPREPVSARTLADAERAHIKATLRETNWVVGGPRGAAAQLGLPRTTLIARMQRLGISGAGARSRSEGTRRYARVIESLASHLPGDAAGGLRVMEATAG